MQEPPSFDPHNSSKIKRYGLIILAAFTCLIVTLIVIGSCGGESPKPKTPVSKPETPGEKLMPVNPAQEDDPTAQPPAGDSSEDYAEPFEVPGARKLNVFLLPSGPRPQIIRAYLGDKIRFENRVPDFMRAVSSDSDKPFSFDSGLIEQGKSRTITLRSTGTINYVMLPAILPEITEKNRDQIKVLRGRIIVVPR